MFFKNYRTIIVVGVVFAAVLILLSYSLRHDSSTSFAKKLVLELAAPVQNILAASVENVRTAWTRYVHLVGLEEDNRILKNKIAELQGTLSLYKEGYLEAERLQALLSLKKEQNYNSVAARVIGREQAAVSKTLWINKGSAHGLQSGMPVINPAGLVGRLTDVAWHSSKVLLLIDENSNVDALIQRTRVQGIVRGAGPRGCVVRYISKTQDVKEGDGVMTSGMGNVFPKGLLIGKVIGVDYKDAGLFLTIRIAPMVDFNALEDVLVLAADQKKISENNKTTK